MMTRQTTTTIPTTAPAERPLPAEQGGPPRKPPAPSTRAPTCQVIGEGAEAGAGAVAAVGGDVIQQDLGGRDLIAGYS